MPFGKNDIVVAPAGAFGGANPKLLPEVAHIRGENVLQSAEIGRQGAITAKTNSEAATAAADAIRARAMANTAAPLTQAQLSKAQADAVKSQMEVDQKRAEAALSTMSPNSDLQGDAYLKAAVPPAMWNVVKAYARGDLGSRSGGMSTSMLPIIQMAMNYDHSASGVNFPARVKMQSDLASGDPKTAGGSLQAFERMLLHGSEVLDAGQKLNNFHSGFGSGALNGVRNAYESLNQSPELAHFNSLVSNYAPEAQKAVAGVAGGEGERQSRAGALSGSVSPEGLTGSLQADAKQAFDAMQATNDRYKRVMGHDILDAMSPAGKAAYDKIMAGGYDPATGKPMQASEGWSPISGPRSGGSGPYGPALGPAGAPVSVATGGTRQEASPQGSAIINAMLHAGSSDDQIDAALNAINVGGVDRKQSAAARAYLKAHPDYKGGFGAATTTVPNSIFSQAVATPVGTALGAYADSAIGGLSDEAAGGMKTLFNGGSFSDNIADANARKNAAFALNPKSAMLGDIAGSATDFAIGANALKGGALAAQLGAKAPYLGAITQGLISGAGHDNDNRLGGATIGAIGGATGYGAGNLLAIPAGAVARSAFGQATGDLVRKVPGAGRMFGARPVTAPSPTGAENAYLGALGADPSGVQGSLTDAARLGVPMSPADASAPLTSLGGAVVRRSPNAAQVAENAFLPRSRGQIDRLGDAVARDLGPVGNIPQLSADLTQQAKTAAGPLYDAAYAAPGASSVDLDDLMTRPSFQSGIGRARNIALEEGRDPTALGFDLNQDGSVSLNRVPSFQTLDYVKGGLDDVLEGNRNPLTGRLVLDRQGAAINGTKNTLLSRMDAVNPDYAAARNAFAGPSASRDALTRGQEAFSMNPNELGVQVAGQTPENLSQMQLGFRSQLMDQANKLRYSSNPFDATLGNPAAEARLSTLYPNNTGNANLLAQRDLEAQLAKSQNSILGNSMTAGRQIADQNFLTSPLLEGAMHAGAAVATHGASVPGTAARVLGNGLKDRLTLGLGAKATAKADELAPMLFNTSPADASSYIDDLLKKQADYQAYVAASRPSALLGMFGAGAGVAAAPGY